MGRHGWGLATAYQVKLALLESVTFHLYLAILSLFSATSLAFCGDVFKISVYIALTHRHDNKHWFPCSNKFHNPRPHLFHRALILILKRIYWSTSPQILTALSFFKTTRSKRRAYHICYLFPALSLTGAGIDNQSRNAIRLIMYGYSPGGAYPVSLTEEWMTFLIFSAYQNISMTSWILSNWVFITGQ